MKRLFKMLYIVVPALGAALLVKKLYADSSEEKKFEQYILKTYGYASQYRDANDDRS